VWLCACADAHEGDIFALCASEDGAMFASGGEDRTVRIFDAKLRKSAARLTELSRAVTALSFDRGGELLAVGSLDGSLRLYKSSRRRARWTLDGVLPGHSGPVRRIVFEAAAPVDAPRLFSASTDRSIKLTDVAAGKRPFVANAPSAVLDMDVLPGIGAVVTGHKDGGLRVWSVKDGGGAMATAAKVHARSVTSVCCLEDGYGVLTLGRDGILKLSDVRQLGEAVREMEGGVKVVSDWHRATLLGRVATCGLGASGAVCHWNVDSGKPFARKLSASAPAADGDVLGLLRGANPGGVIAPLWTPHGLVGAHSASQVSLWQ
jgi:WD40 repeat protein